MNSFWRALRTAGIWGLLNILAVAQAEDEPRGDRQPTAEEISVAVKRAAGLLENVRPTKVSQTERVPWKIMELSDGSIRWGNLFRKEEIAALVNVKESGEDSDYDPLPQYLSYFVWRNGEWNFQQFLGNAYGLEIHYRKDRPLVFLQGHYRSGRHDGEFLSWYFDSKSGRLERTHFEDWGPFVLKGNYLVTQRGFERLAHDTTTRIFEYRDGKKGRFVAECDQNDSGDFIITYRDGQTRAWRRWGFQQDRENESRMLVTLVELGDASDPRDFALGEVASQTAATNDPIIPEEVFQRLTGLNPALLGADWGEVLLPAPPVDWSPVQAIGDPEIVNFLQSGMLEQRRIQEKRILEAVQDLVPGGKLADAQIISGDIRGVLGKLLGGNEFSALLAIGLPEAGESAVNSTLFLLEWQDKWKLRQRIGSVSGAVDYDGKLGWILRRDENRGIYYLLSHMALEWLLAFHAWKFEETAKEFIPVEWKKPGLMSIAGDTVTFSNLAHQPETARRSDIYEFSGKLGSWLGSVERGSSSEQLARFRIKVWDPVARQVVTWRLWKTKRGYSTEADTYSLCRDEGDGNPEFREDATVKINWGEYGFGEMDAALFVWWRLTGIGANPVLGEWSKDAHLLRRTPRAVEVKGLPEAVERISFSGQ